MHSLEEVEEDLRNHKMMMEVLLLEELSKHLKHLLVTGLSVQIYPSIGK